MKLLGIAILLLAAAVWASAQTPAGTPTTFGIDSVFLARDDGKGKPGEEVSSFTVADVPIHCVVAFEEPKAAVIKMVFVAVDVAGVRKDSKVVTTVYTTKANETSVNFTGKPYDRWHPGKYRVDIFVDGKLATNLPFDIRSGGTPAGGSSFAPIKQAATTIKP